MLNFSPSPDQPQAMPGRHRRIPSSNAAEEVSTFGVVQESTKPCEQDPTGRYVRYPMLLGRGACKRVFRAFDCEEGKEVAWNQVELAGVQISEETRNRLFAEIHVLQRLHHKNIMSFMSYFYNPKLQTINFITEIFMSGTLRQYRKKVCVMNENILKRWAWQILEGLVYMHGHEPPIVHRDLKCDNIFVNGNTGQIKIGDLGYATAQQGLSVVGTPEFMAPEIYEEKYDHKVDIYSFGMCLLELATLEFPYSECHGVAHIFRKVTQGIKPQALQRVSSEQLREIIELCIAHDPEQRPEARLLLKHPYFAQLRVQGSAMLGAGSQYSSTPNLSAHAHAADPNGLPVTQLHRTRMGGGLGVPSHLSPQEADGRREAAPPPFLVSPTQVDLGAGAGGGGLAAAPGPRADLSSELREGSGGASLPPRAPCAEGCSGSTCTHAHAHAPALHGFGSALLRREASLRPPQLQEAGLPGPARVSADAFVLGGEAARVVVGSQTAGAMGLSEDSGEHHDSQVDASTPAPLKQRMESLSLSRSLDRRDRLHQSVDLSQLAQQLYKRDGSQGAERDDAMSESSSDEVVIIPLQCLASMDFPPPRADADAAAGELQLDGLGPGAALPDPGLQRDSWNSMVMLSSATSLMSSVSTHSSPTTSRAASAAPRAPSAARAPSPSLYGCRSAPAMRKPTVSAGGELEPPPLSPSGSVGPALGPQPLHASGAQSQEHSAVTRNRSSIAIPLATNGTSAGQESAPSPLSPPAVPHPAAGASGASAQARPTICVESMFHAASTQPLLTTPVHQTTRPRVQRHTEPFTSISYTGGGHEAIAEAMHSFADADQPPLASPGSRRHHANTSSPQVMLADEEPQQAEGSASASRPIHGVIVRLKQCKGQGFCSTIQRDRLRRATTM